MKILYISGWYPYPPGNGAEIREFNLIRRLAARHEISLLSFYTLPDPMTQERLDGMADHCRRVKAVPYKEFKPTGFKALLALCSPSPRAVIDTYSHDMAKLVQDAVAGEVFDVVVTATQRTAPYALLAHGAPRVFEEIELAVLYEKYAKARGLAQARYGLMWWKQARYLRNLLSGFDGGTVASELERELVHGVTRGDWPLAVVPNGVDLQVNTGDFGAPQPDTLIYSGALTYEANFDAMAFFLRDVFPLIRAQCPNVRLRITGRYEGAPLERLPLGEGVELTGYLQDIRPAVAQSWVCVVPLRMGGGTRLKILEAMALGTPVIATRKGAEGLDVAHEENILIADAPGDLARAVLCVLKDQALRARLSANGRRLVEERYSWDKSAHELEQLLHRVVESGRANC